MDQDWNRLGNDIKNMVQDAINSQDFSRLNQGINNVINGAVDGLGNLMGNKSQGGYWEIRDDGKPRPGQAPPYGQAAGSGPEGQDMYGRQSRGGSWSQQGPRFNDQRVNQRAEKEKKLPAGPYKSPSGISAAGYTMAILGGIVAAGTGTALAICLIVALAAPPMTSVTAAGLNIANSILFFLTLLFGAVCWGGTKKIGLAKRFKRYVRCICGRGYCQLEELSRSIGRPEAFIRKDVKKMLHKGLFLEGHLDKQETCLITTDQAYDQYKSAQRQLEERQRREWEDEQASREKDIEKSNRKNREAQEEAKVPPEVQSVLDEGQTYLERIRKCNDLILGQEISDKISKMELIVQNIFQRVQGHPEVVPDLKKMMDYYLPTTVKLLDAYAELDAQPVQVENITNSKREIEQTLDTLNQAFEKLLDQIFRDTAWDVSTDISVLQTLLAQEGLIGDDFKLN